MVRPTPHFSLFVDIMPTLSKKKRNPLKLVIPLIFTCLALSLILLPLTDCYRLPHVF